MDSHFSAAALLVERRCRGWMYLERKARVLTFWSWDSACRPGAPSIAAVMMADRSEVASFTPAEGVFFQSQLCLPTATALSCLMCPEPGPEGCDLLPCCDRSSCGLRPSYRSVSEAPFRFGAGPSPQHGGVPVKCSEVALCFLNLFLIVAVLAIAQDPDVLGKPSGQQLQTSPAQNQVMAKMYLDGPAPTLM